MIWPVWVGIGVGVWIGLDVLWVVLMVRRPQPSYGFLLDDLDDLSVSG